MKSVATCRNSCMSAVVPGGEAGDAASIEGLSARAAGLCRHEDEDGLRLEDRGVQQR